MSGVKEYIDTNLYDDNKKSYVRNTEDKKMDISIIGAVTPFNVFKGIIVGIVTGILYKRISTFIKKL